MRQKQRATCSAADSKSKDSAPRLLDQCCSWTEGPPLTRNDTSYPVKPDTMPRSLQLLACVTSWCQAAEWQVPGTHPQWLTVLATMMAQVADWLSSSCVDRGPRADEAPLPAWSLILHALRLRCLLCACMRACPGADLQGQH